LINPQSYKWFFETTTPVEGHMHAIVRTLIQAQTKFQQVEIMETASYGKCLVLDGRIQSSQHDEFIYHEALVHPGLLAVEGAPKSALVIGGGEGATLREFLRYPSLTRAVMVDIDGEVVELCKRHLPEMHQGAFDDPRTELRHEDARAYLERTSDRFDLIVSLSPEAHHQALNRIPALADAAEYWPTFDPSLAEGSREQMLLEYRTVRDGLDRRIAQRFARPSTG